MFPNFIIIVLQYFDFCGFCTEHNVISSEKSRSKQSILIFVIHIINFIAQFAIIVIRFIMHPILNFNAISRMNDYIKYIGVLLSYSGSTIELMCSRRYQRSIWKLFIKNHCGTNTAFKSNLFHCLRFKCILYFIVNLCASIRIFSFVIPYWQTTEAPFWCSLYFLFFMHQSKVFFYSFYIDLVINEFKSINNIILSEKNLSFELKEQKTKKVGRNCEKVKRIRHNYQSIQSMVDCLNNIFGWSQFITVIYCFSVLVCEFNYLYWRIVKLQPFNYLGK